MDHFGIGGAIMAAVKIYSETARGSGRTTSLIHSLKTGDRVVFHATAEANRVRRLCLDLGKDVECIVIDPNATYSIRDWLGQRGTPKGRLLFDHTWVEMFYRGSIQQTCEEIDHLQREFGGWGEATRRRAQAAWQDAYPLTPDPQWRTGNDTD